MTAPHGADLSSARITAFDSMERIMKAAAGRPLTTGQHADFAKSFDEFSQAATADWKTAGAHLLASVKANEPEAAFTAADRYMRLPQPTLAAGHDQPGQKPGYGGWTTENGAVKTLAPRERLSDLVETRAGEGLSMNAFVKAAVTGDWRGIDPELKAMSLGTGTAGGYMVPDVLSANVIDKARNAARVIQAGATTVPMTESRMLLARIATDPTAGWKAENAAITASDMVLEQVVLQAHTLVALVKMSVELVEDGHGVVGTIENAIGQALALELDRAALRGSGTTPEPRGILNQSGVNVQTSGANGTAIGSYAWLSTAIQTVEENNGEPNAVIYAPRTAGEFDRLVDTTGQPLRQPPLVDGIRKLVTNQVPINLTTGTSSDTSEAYVGEWPELLVGVRTNLMIELSRVAGDDTGGAFTSLQVWCRAYLRADIALAQPSHFVVVKGLR